MSRARIHRLFERPLDGRGIEAESMRRIEAEAPPHALGPAEWQIARRLVHTTADFGVVEALTFSQDAIASGCAALEAGAPIYADSSMVASGLSLGRLRQCSPRYDRERIRVHVADPDVIEAARASGLPRAVHALRRARPMLPGAIVCFGNSPVGLLELSRMVLEEGLRVALVVAMPVGFVHVEESKEELLTLNVPKIVLRGRRGGSPLAVATVHALCEISAGSRASQPGASQASPPSALGATPDEAIILLGHGSRVPDAGDSMHVAAAHLKARLGHPRIEVCFMSRLGPHLPETVARCVGQGARRIVVVPYFLHGGMHIHLDIPEMLRECAAAHPGVSIVLAERLGYDDQLVDIIERRISAARAMPDVRALVLPPRERYPVPDGQDEFVAMPPEMAARWRAAMDRAEGGKA